ncbi:hypothetical protein BLNAU_21654 [Blattamonas nauphoetae]|uniref:Uncharacterized protein n=1 Tax=Blattamonas nauphoetae TaxID=2049346 RepID=A0ABQ9WVA0_9EUKA|nr:hypothetical protein BLNAU_21654 [Blattamonas nauphoetae]
MTNDIHHQFILLKHTKTHDPVEVPLKIDLIHILLRQTGTSEPNPSFQVTSPDIATSLPSAPLRLVHMSAMHFHRHSPPTIHTIHFCQSVKHRLPEASARHFKLATSKKNLP